MTRADLVHRLSLLDPADAVACVTEAASLRRAARLEPDEDKRRMVLQICADAYSVTVEAILGRGRTSRVAAARQTAYLLLMAALGMSSVEVGRYMGRNHSTVLHGSRRARGDSSIASASAVDAVLAALK